MRSEPDKDEEAQFWTKYEVSVGHAESTLQEERLELKRG